MNPAVPLIAGGLIVLLLMALALANVARRLTRLERLVSTKAGGSHEP